MTIAYLRAATVEVTSVKLLDMSPNDTVAALLHGDIDAAFVWEPSLNKMVTNGGKILMDSGTVPAHGYPTWDIGRGDE